MQQDAEISEILQEPNFNFENFLVTFALQCTVFVFLFVYDAFCYAAG